MVNDQAAEHGADHAAEHGADHAADHGADHGADHAAGDPTATYVRVAGHDELHHEGESLVLIAGEVKRISALGTLLRELAQEPRTLEELTAGLVEEFGEPPEASAADVTRQAVEAMVDAGLMEQLTA